MARTFGFKGEDGTFYDCFIKPDVEKINHLIFECNLPTASVSRAWDRMADLVVFERETQKYKNDIKLAAENGSVEAMKILADCDDGWFSRRRWKQMISKNNGQVKYDVIEFRKCEFDFAYNNHCECIDIFINGHNLLDSIIECSSDNAYAELAVREFYDGILDVLEGKEKDKIANIYGCSCGVTEDNPLQIRIDVSDKAISWSEFYGNRHFGADWAQFGFIFEKQQFMAEFNKIEQWLGIPSAYEGDGLLCCLFKTGLNRVLESPTSRYDDIVKECIEKYETYNSRQKTAIQNFIAEGGWNNAAKHGFASYPEKLAHKLENAILKYDDVTVGQLKLNLHEERWWERLNEIEKNSAAVIAPVLVLPQTPLVMSLVGGDVEKSLYAFPEIFSGLTTLDFKKTIKPISKDVLNKVARAFTDPIAAFYIENSDKKECSFILDIITADNSTVVADVDLAINKQDHEEQFLNNNTMVKCMKVLTEKENIFLVDSIKENCAYINREKWSKWAKKHNMDEVADLGYYLPNIIRRNEDTETESTGISITAEKVEELEKKLVEIVIECLKIIPSGKKQENLGLDGFAWQKIAFQFQYGWNGIHELSMDIIDSECKKAFYDLTLDDQKLLAQEFIFLEEEDIDEYEYLKAEDEAINHIKELVIERAGYYTLDLPEDFEG